MAGWDNELKKLLQSGTDAVLVSYYYVRKHKKEVLDALRPLIEEINDGRLSVILDSGAFSLFGQDNVTKENLESYLAEYISFVRSYSELFTAVVELDVADLVGQSVVDKWREEVFEKLTKDIPDLYVIYVWHTYNTDKEWLDMCKKYPYVALASDAGGRTLQAGSVGKAAMAVFKRKILVAKKLGSKVHAFAITKKQPLKEIMFFSADSITHLMGGKYGATFIFTGNDLTRIDDDKTVRNRYKNKYIKLGFDWAKIKADVRSEINAVNAYAWVEYSQWLCKKRNPKVYWRNDCAGKIRAAFDNTHHSLHLSKFKQMDIPWSEIDRQRIVSGVEENRLDEVVFKDKSYNKKRKKILLEEAVFDFNDKEDAKNIYGSMVADANHSVDISEETDLILAIVVNSEERKLEDIGVSNSVGNNSIGDTVNGVSRGSDTNSTLGGVVIYEPPEAKFTSEEIEIQNQIAKRVGAVDIDVADLMRFVPMREEGDADNLDTKASPLSKKERDLAVKRLMQGLDKGNIMMCNACYVSDSCPAFQRNSLCAFPDLIKLGEVGRRITVQDLARAQRTMAQQMYKRAQMMLMFEQIQGGYEDTKATKLMQISFDMMERTKDILSEADLSDKIANSQAHNEENPQSQSILSRVFGLGPEKIIDDDEEGIEEVEEITDAEFAEAETQSNKAEFVDDD